MQANSIGGCNTPQGELIDADICMPHHLHNPRAHLAHWQQFANVCFSYVYYVHCSTVDHERTNVANNSVHE